jgi:hypothetical protein
MQRTPVLDFLVVDRVAAPPHAVQRPHQRLRRATSVRCVKRDEPNLADDLRSRLRGQEREHRFPHRRAVHRDSTPRSATPATPGDCSVPPCPDTRRTSSAARRGALVSPTCAESRRNQGCTRARRSICSTARLPSSYSFSPEAKPVLRRALDQPAALQHHQRAMRRALVQRHALAHVRQPKRALRSRPAAPAPRPRDPGSAADTDRQAQQFSPRWLSLGSHSAFRFVFCSHQR